MANKENNLENDDISRLLGSIKSVEAPGDFDVRVRAKIAQGRPSGRRGWITVPVAAAMLVTLAVGYIGFRSYLPYASPAQPVQIASQPGVLPQSAPPQVADQPQPETAYVPQDQRGDNNGPMTSKRRDVDPRMVNKTVSAHEAKPGTKQDGGGSVDMASTITEPLSKIGAETNRSGTVGEVKQNSVAERSGVKAGDVVVKVTGKSIRVRRDGKVLDIALKP